MRKSLIKGLRFFKDLTQHFCRDFSTYFYKAWKAGLIRSYANSFARSLIFYLNQFRIYLYVNGIQQHHIKEEKFERLKKTSLGLHTLLPPDARFSYSILILAHQPRLNFFQECLEGALQQTAPRLEILIGLMHPPSRQMEEFLSEIQKTHSMRIAIFPFFHEEESEAINQLAEKATGNYLFIMGEEDWIRPDLFLRYEQTLRVFSNPEKRVLYCNLNALNDKGYFIPNSEYRQPTKLCFPFMFKPFLEKGWLIPAALWKQIGGLQADCKGAEYEQLLLQLDLADAHFQHLPLNLYSLRASSPPKAAKSQTAFLKVLKCYSIAKRLEWDYLPGYQENSVRAIPPLPNDHAIQVVIPYKEQKELTLKCIHSVLKQKNVNFVITAIDNCSKDESISQEIQDLGGEVIAINEPFNYSRLNNLAVKTTQIGTHCNVVLFLNNDVELEEEALSEMLRWIDQPGIGIVGCRLHYPDGRLQHGGVEINFHGKEEMRWEHIEKLRRFEEMNRAKTLGIFEAVTTACAMMKRQTFLEVGGFDEIWYPIGYSDTNLAVKIAAKGLKCFYTPYAVGIHHESVSRKSAIEDYENSWWLHHLLIQNGKMDDSPFRYFPK